MRDQSGRAGDANAVANATGRALPRSNRSRPTASSRNLPIMSDIRSANASAVTVVTQTRVEPSFAEGFARWQRLISEAVATQPGFIKETVMPPSPPAQVDWSSPALREH